MAKGRINLVEGAESSVIIKLTIPMIYGFLSVIGVSLVDAYFIGKLGTSELAAFGFIFPIIFIFNGIILGIGNGSSALVAKAYGAGNINQTKRLTTDALILGVGLIFVLSIIGQFTITPLFTLLGAKADIMPIIDQYMKIWYSGAAFVVFPMIGNSAMTAVGNTRTPANIMLLVMLFNSLFDPIFIFGFGPIPELGFAGAAWATVSSRIFVLFFSLYVLVKKDKIITFVKPKFSEVLESWKGILYIGVPNAATNIIVPLGFGIITHLAAKFGKEAVAAIGVAERIEALSITVILAVAVAMSPFVGQNLGAKKFDRIRTGLRKAMQFSFYWGALLMVILFFSAEYIIQFFNTDPLVISYFKQYFRIVPISYCVLGMLYITGVTLNVYNKPFHSAMLTLTRVFFAYVPLAYLFTYLFGIDGIFYSALIANIITGIFSIYTLNKQNKIVFEAHA